MNDSQLKRLRPTRSIQLALLASVVLGCGLIVASVIQAAAGRADQLPSAIGQPLTEVAAVSFPNCRFGAGGAISSAYAIPSLNLGWYMDWSTQLNPVRPNSAEYVQVIRLSPTDGGYTFTSGLPVLYQIADQNPGAVWLIGNEPDSQFQDKLPPETYAQAYHDLYGWLKQHDPSAQIGAGSIVQPTPLRLQYLDRVLTAYRQVYGQSMPVDVWSIHSYILREIDTSDPQACLDGNCTEPPYEIWGAFIPTGMLSTATRGELYSLSKTLDAAIFRQRLIDFRSWLKNRGYRDTPVYITEFGTLLPYWPYVSDPFYDELGQEMTEARSITFMQQAFNVLLTATDAAVGQPADGNRLVQRWLWYSLDDTRHFGGALFNPQTGQRTALGNAWASYVQAITSTVDLLAVRVVAEPAAVKDTGQTQTTTLKATVSNQGNIAITQPITVAFYAGVPPTGSLIGLQTVSKTVLAGCAATVDVTITWPNLGPGLHPMYVQLDPSATVPETDRTNNQAVGQFLVAAHQVYLPVIPRN